MALPFGIEPPRWLQEQDSWIKGISSRGVSELFNGANAVVQMEGQKLNQASTILHMQQQAQGIELNKLNIDRLSDDYKTIPEWLKDHPTWDSRQDAEWPAAKTPQGEKMLNDVRLRDSQSIQAEAATSAVHDFAKRVDALRQVDPQSAGEFAPYITQRKSPEILQALAMAEERAQVHQQNLAKQQEIEAAAAGAQTRTVVGPKGTTTTYTSPKPADTTVPKTLDLGNGTTIAWVPGGKTLHVIKAGNSEKKELTPEQLRNIAKGLDDADPRKNQINDFLANSAVGQISQPTNAAPAKVLKYNPATGKVE